MTPAPWISEPSYLSFWGCLAGVVLFIGGMVLASDLRAQTRPQDTLSLVERYRTMRFQMLAQDYLVGRRSLPIRPARSLPVRVNPLIAGAIASDTARTTEKGARSFPVSDVRLASDLERSWFRDRYREVEWSFLGTGIRLTFFDTTRTRALRARLQDQFGDPTRTLAEVYSNEWALAPDSTREDPIQFEYWFVVNDSIPVRVSDINGPMERGVIVSTAREYRDELVALRKGLLHPLRESEPATYVDYYYEEATRRWYRVGFDGRSYFRERISRFDIVPGRRPHLDSVRTRSAADVSDEASPSIP